MQVGFRREGENGLLAFAAAMGELRMPGTWNGMLADFEQSPGMRLQQLTKIHPIRCAVRDPRGAYEVE